MTTWVPVRDYEEAYEISDDGQVRSLTRQVNCAHGATRTAHGKILTPGVKASGHLYVLLKSGSRAKHKYVHRLAAEAYVEGREEGLEVCHNDGDPTNNAASNLRWDTRSANIRDSVAHGTNHWASKTQCPQGHEYSGDNLTYSKKGSRLCVICTRASHRTASARYRSRINAESEAR